jgi:hypothetical protein
MNSNFSAATLAKAIELLDAGRVVEDEDFPFWYVNGDHGLYRVQTDGKTYAACTCKHGLNAPVDDTRCAHVAAVRALTDPLFLLGLNVKGLVP